METDINVPKTKGVNFMFQNIKFHIYVYILVNVGQWIMHSQDHYCTADGKSMRKLMEHGSVCMIIINVLGLFYIWCRDQFARLEFWLIYATNFFWFLIVFFDIISAVTSQKRECMEVIMSQKSFAFLGLKNQIELVICLSFQMEYAAKFVNMASNLLFPYLLLSSGKDLGLCHDNGSIIIFSICFSHIFINILAAIMNSVLMCMGRKGRKLQSFRFFILIAVVSFLIVYVIVFISYNQVKQERQCVPMEYTLRAYIQISPIAIASMLTILLSVKSDLGGDVREKALIQHQKHANDQDYIMGVTSKIGGGAYGVVSQANHTDKSKVAQIKQGFGSLKQ
ncbi:transmembrane protein, putative (macronuclear) [Tetrahymena thermophila SB210]|uniref:Transmembrane protein, putative n=1 Tax=Tetrahymena thermophila (strain SB210) TaxID=312017 RepID=Q23WW2_TETTS|nr:transmembrane protein, putative [Tetrahymena thermophila SB210]EAS00983.2 transmembrane protein, putative [Tetrahymena thermophila SB210]|eukprot:XP_001021228.2 transmembrane protein, putative [Tetrahymena thermophila SB210]